MGYIRLVHSGRTPPMPGSSCVEAYDRELDYLFETLHRMGAGKREVEDLAHEVFVVLHRNWATVDHTRPLRPYLFGIAFRIVCAHRRRRAREIPSPNLEITDSGVSPEGLLQSKQSIELLHAALECVPLKRRAVVVMHDLDDIPIADIAQALSISRFGTYARLRKARLELAAAVERLLKGKKRG